MRAADGRRHAVLHRPRPLARRRSARSRRWRARPSTRTSCSSTGWRVPSRIASARKARASEYLLHGLNPERILVAGAALGRGRDGAEARDATMPKERIVFGRPIGQNQAIQHPLAECWMRAAGGRAADVEGGLRCTTPASPAASRPRRQVPGGGGRLRDGIACRAHARRLRLREGVPRRARPARERAVAARAGHAGARAVLRRRAGARAAEVVLRTARLAAHPIGALFTLSQVPPRRGSTAWRDRAPRSAPDRRAIHPLAGSAQARQHGLAGPRASQRTRSACYSPSRRLRLCDGPSLDRALSSARYDLRDSEGGQDPGRHRARVAQPARRAQCLQRNHDRGADRGVRRTRRRPRGARDRARRPRQGVLRRRRPQLDEENGELHFEQNCNDAIGLRHHAAHASTR